MSNDNPSLTSAIEWLSSHTGHFATRYETQYVLYRKLGGPQTGLNGCGKPRSIALS